MKFLHSRETVPWLSNGPGSNREQRVRHTWWYATASITVGLLVFVGLLSAGLALPGTERNPTELIDEEFFPQC